MSNVTAIPVGLVQKYIPHYRLPFFRRLQEGSEFEWHFHSGSYPPGESSGIPADISVLCHHPIANHWGPRATLWQRGVLTSVRRHRLRAVVFEMGWPILSNWWLVWRMRRMGVVPVGWGKVLRTSNRRYPPGARFMQRLLLRQCRAFLVYGQTAREALAEVFSVEPGKIFVAQNAVDSTGIVAREALSRAEGEALRRKAGWGPSDTVVGFIGRLSERKAPEVLLRAYLRLRQEGHDSLRLLIAGGGPQRALLEQEAAASPWARDIHFTGTLPAGAEHGAFQAMDICASVGASGLSVLECMAHARTPLIMPERVPETELVQDGVNGFISRNFTPASYLDALRSAVECPDLTQMGEEARRCVLTRSTHEHMATTFVSAIRHALAT